MNMQETTYLIDMDIHRNEELNLMTMLNNVNLLDLAVYSDRTVYRAVNHIRTDTNSECKCDRHRDRTVYLPVICDNTAEYCDNVLDVIDSITEDAVAMRYDYGLYVSGHGATDDHMTFPLRPWAPWAKITLNLSTRDGALVPLIHIVLVRCDRKLTTWARSMSLTRDTPTEEKQREKMRLVFAVNLMTRCHLPVYANFTFDLLRPEGGPHLRHIFSLGQMEQATRYLRQDWVFVRFGRNTHYKYLRYSIIKNVPKAQRRRPTSLSKLCLCALMEAKSGK
jgi:hypothetical protein